MRDEKNALIIEDDDNLSDLLALHLADLGYTAERAYRGDEGLKKGLSRVYKLIILDLMLPGLDGFSICRQLRRKDWKTPIIMLTAKTDEIDKIIGLEIGADDYITKPFSTRELTARIKAVTRRTEEPKAVQDGEVLVFGNLKIDEKKRLVTVNDAPVELTAKEYDLLVKLAKNPGRPFTREQLLSSVWGYQYEGYSHTVNSHINRLRNKIERDPSAPEHIKTVWGYGYRFSENQEI
jgi:DNA-binding response OmpR family regulator